MANNKAFVIVGAGMAGAKAAETLRAKGFEDRIFLIGDEGRLPYERPPLSKECLIGSKTLDVCTIREWDGWMEAAVHLVMNDPVAAIDTGTGSVRLSSGIDIRAEKVLIATGGVAATLDVPGAHLPGIHTLRTADDSDILGDRLRRGRSKVAVIGGGLLAVEVVAGATALGNDVTWLCRSRHPLTGAVGAHASTHLRRIYEDAGFHVMPGVSVAGFTGREHVTGVILDDGRTVEADIVLTAVGQRPALDFLDRATFDTTHGLSVDERLETRVPGVYAAGDVARFVDPYVGGTARHGTWANAQAQGEHAAAAMLGDKTSYRSVPWYWSDHGDLNVQVAGRIDETATIVERRRSDRSVSWIYLDGERVVGAVGVDSARDVRASMLLMERGGTVAPDAVRDVGTDLRKLVGAVAAL